MSIPRRKVVLETGFPIHYSTSTPKKMRAGGRACRFQRQWHSSQRNPFGLYPANSLIPGSNSNVLFEFIINQWPDRRGTTALDWPPLPLLLLFKFRYPNSVKTAFRNFLGSARTWKTFAREQIVGRAYREEGKNWKVGFTNLTMLKEPFVQWQQ